MQLINTIVKVKSICKYNLFFWNSSLMVTNKIVNFQINGIQTVTENIADNGGIKLAYRAYNNWASRNPVEPQLPNLNYTPQQMFWIGAATVWCAKSTNEFLHLLLSDDTHSPSEARVVASFSNIDEFVNDFNCPVGSKMNPEKKCYIW